VSHHPPITAFQIKNKQRKLLLNGNFTFGVRFETNSVVCTTDGFVEIRSLDPNLEDEIYKIDKGLPDLLINNVILGTRTMGWTGEVNIICEKTSLVTNLNFKKHKNRVTIEGAISRYDERLYDFEGLFMEDPIYVNPCVDYLEKSLLFNEDLIEKLEIIYPTPLEVPELNSFKVWSTVTESIINNDMNLADIEKKRIEAEQRRRTKHWNNNNFQYFAFDEDGNKWVYSKKQETEHNAS